LDVYVRFADHPNDRLLGVDEQECLLSCCNFFCAIFLNGSRNEGLAVRAKETVGIRAPV
jgi:hypothetical protein